MGASVPVFQLVSRAHGVPISVLYGTNTAGAALGVLFVTFVLLPRLGVAQTCWTVASLNLLVFCITLLRWPFRESQAHARAIPADREPRQELGFRLALWIVLGTGLATFGLEVAWFRALGAAFWSTSATFAIILVSVLGPMALGARLVPWMRRREISPGTVLCGAGVAILLATPFIERMDLYIAVSGSFSVILTKWLLLSMSIVGIPILLLSMALPKPSMSSVRKPMPGDVITDDNQLLAFGRIEAGSRGTSRPGLDRQNHRALRRAAGREALRLDPRAFD
jgi:hypothetical protein